jgi:hypothetical protein
VSYEATVFRAYFSLVREIYLQEHHKDCLALHYYICCKAHRKLSVVMKRVNVQALGQLTATNSYGLQVLTDCSLQGAEIVDEMIETWHCHRRSQQDVVKPIQLG